MRSRQSPARRELTTPDGLITVPPDSPKILIHTRLGKCVGIYCDQPAKVLMVETQDDLRRRVQGADFVCADKMWRPGTAWLCSSRFSPSKSMPWAKSVSPSG